MNRLFMRLASVVLAMSGLVLGDPARTRAADDNEAAIRDDWFGFTLKVGKPWEKAPLNPFMVPGVTRCGWSGPNQSSIVVFMQEPGTAANPRVVLDDSATAMRDKLGVTVSVAEVRTVAGMQAMWMVVSGDGSGSALSGTGDVQTTQHWVVIPRERDVVVLLLTSPAADFPRLQPSFEAVVKSLTLTGAQTAEQRAAK